MLCVKPLKSVLAGHCSSVKKARERDNRCCRLQPGTWLRAIDFGCAQPVQEGESLTRKTGTPMFMVRRFLHRCVSTVPTSGIGYYTVGVLLNHTLGQERSGLLPLRGAFATALNKKSCRYFMSAPCRA